jgi:hypothetical protein
MDKSWKVRPQLETITTNSLYNAVPTASVTVNRLDALMVPGLNKDGETDAPLY